MAAILLVEPNVAFRRMMEQLLRQSGHEVFGADDADTAGRAMKDHELDLVVIEMKLPGTLQGSEFLEWMRDVPPPGDPARMAVSSVPVLAQQEAYFRAELALDGFLVKPFKPSSFKNAVEAALKAASGRPKRDWTAPRGLVIPPPPDDVPIQIELDSNPGIETAPAPSPNEFETASGDDTISLEDLASPPPFEERRSVPRVPVRLPCAVHDGKNPFRARTENLAQAGAFIATDRLLTAGTIVRVRLELPTGGTGFNEITCEVVHAASATDATTPGAGLRFTEIPEETSKRLAAFLEELRAPAAARPFLVVASGSMAGQVELLAQKFRSDEVRVRFVKAGDDVRTAAENEPPDLILVDLADPMLVAHIGALKSARATSRIPVGLVDFTRSTQATLIAAAAAADKFFVLPEEGDRLLEFSIEVLNASRRRSVRVKYQRPIVVRRDGKEDRGAGVDLSETGVQVRLAQAPREKSSAEIVLRLSDDGPPLTVPAMVQWVTPAGDEADLAWRVGFLFEPDDAARSRIREEIRRALTASYYVRWLSRAPKPAKATA